MPYIEKSRREKLRVHVDAMAKEISEIVDLRNRIFTASTAVANIALVMTSNPNPHMKEIVKELSSRKDDILGDLNFCISRLLVIATQIHKEPKYGKFVCIESILESTISYIKFFYGEDKIFALATLKCVGRELYRRYGIPYENIKMKINGDITD